MKIGSSQISMASSREYSQVAYRGFASLTSQQGQQLAVDRTDGAKSIFEQLKDEKSARGGRTGNQGVDGSSAIQRPSYNGDGMQTINSVAELKDALINQLIGSLRGRRYPMGGGRSIWGGFGFGFGFNQNLSFMQTSMQQGNLVLMPQTYTVQTVWSDFYAERETTAFVSQGKVKTEDGREINFDVSFEMSRAFEQSTETYTQRQYVMCDPLVVNFKGDVAELGDQKFYFDLDADGEEEEISGFSSNSGFLALDLNGDGVINDGSELFGTKSGNGFADLAKYDSDGNGWIDDNDEVFAKLKVWTKDADGNDVLMSAKERGMGAIYLGNVDTEFNLTDSFDNALKGAVRRSGVYLNEDGTAGTIQHVDFAI